MSNYFDNKTSFLEPLVREYGSNQVMTNVNKPKKIKYLNVDTRFSDDYVNVKNHNSNKNHVITFPEQITNVISLSVSHIEIPKTFYNISSDLGNNNFLVNDKTIVNIKNGNYNDKSLLVFQNLPTDLTFTIDDNSYVKFKNNSVTASYTINFAIDVSGNVDKYSFKSKLGWLLGFRKDKYVVGPSVSIESESAMDCSPVRYLYLVLDEYSSSFPNSFTSFYTNSVMNKKIIARINASNNEYRTLINGNISAGLLVSDTRIYGGKVDIKRLNIELVNEWGKKLNLNGSDFSFLLKIEHE